MNKYSIAEVSEGCKKILKEEEIIREERNEQKHDEPREEEIDQDKNQQQDIETSQDRQEPTASKKRATTTLICNE